MDEKRYIETQNYIREFITILFIKKRIILISILLILAIIIGITAFWPRTYMSEAEILVKQKKLLKNPELLEKVSFSQPMVTEEDINSEIKIITSDDIIEKSIRKLQGDIFKTNLSENQIIRLVREIKSNLKAQLVPKSNVFKITLYWNDPYKSQQILNVILEQYFEYRKNIYAPTKIETFFKEQVETFQNKIKELQKKLVELASNSTSPNPDEQIQNNFVVQKNLEIQLNNLLNKYVEKQKMIKYIEKLLKSNEINCFSFIDNINIGNFGQKLQNLLIEREKMRGIYAENSDPILAINEQIKIVNKALKEEVKRYVEGEKAKLKAMGKSIKDISDRLNKIKEENLKLYNISIQKKNIQKELDLVQQSYDTFLKRWEEAKIDRNGNASSLFAVSLISNPKVNLTPVFPNKRKLLPIGIILSLILGITIGFIVEFFDHTFKRPEDTERYIGIKTIFSIPDINN